MLSDQEHTKEGARDILVEIDTEFRMLKGCMAVGERTNVFLAGETYSP